MSTGLWTPAGGTLLGVSPAGWNVETGGQIHVTRLMLNKVDKFGEPHSQVVHIVSDKAMSKGQIEEMMGNAADKFMQEVREKYDKRPPTLEERKEIGRALNEFNVSMKRRRASTAKKIYF